MFNIVLFCGHPHVITYALATHGSDTNDVSCLDRGGEVTQCTLQSVPFLRSSDWLESLDHPSARILAHDASMNCEYDYSRILPFMKANRSPAETEHLCRECSQMFDWALFPWAPRDCQHSIALVTTKDSIVKQLIKGHSTHAAPIKTLDSGYIISIVEIGMTFSESFDTAIYTEAPRSEGSLIWETIIAAESPPYVVYHNQDSLLSANARERWETYEYNLICNIEEHRRSIYQPLDKLSFMGMCQELRRDGVDWLSVISGSADIDSVVRLISECETRTHEILIYDVRAFQEYRKRVPWFYAPDRGFGETIEVAVFTSSERSLVGKISSSWSSRYTRSEGRCDLFSLEGNG